MKASYGWLALLFVAAASADEPRPLQRVYVHPQAAAVDATDGGVLFGMGLDKREIDAPREADPVAHWSHPWDVVVVKRTREADNPFNPRLGPPMETPLEEVLKKPAGDREIEFVGASDTSDGVNLRAKLTAKADPKCAYSVVVKQPVAAARKEEGMPVEVVKRVEDARKPLEGVEQLLADVRKHLPDSPFARLLIGYVQEKVYRPLGKTGETDGAAAVQAFAAEVGAVVAAVPEDRRAAFARLVFGDTDEEDVGKLVARFGAKVPDAKTSQEMGKALDVTREYLAGYVHADTRRYAEGRGPKTAAELSHLVLARKFTDLMHHREANRLPLGNGDAWAYWEALRVLAVTPAAVSVADGKAVITHPALKGAKLSPTAFNERVAAAVEHLSKPGTLDATITRVQALEEKVREKASNDDAVNELAAVLVPALDGLYTARGDFDLATAGLAGVAAVLVHGTDIETARPDHLRQAAVGLVALPEALKRAGMEVHEDLKPFAAGPEVPAEWLLALAGGRALSTDHSVHDGGDPLLLDISKLSADEWRAFAREALPVLDQRPGGVQLLRSTDPATLERAASLRFGQRITVLAHDGLRSLDSVKVAGQAFPVGELCHDAMKVLQQNFDDGVDPRPEVGRVQFKFAQAETGEGLLKEWTDAAEAGEFAGRVVVLTLCPAEVSGKKIDRLVADLLDPKKGKAAAVVVPTDAGDVRHFALAAVQAAAADGVPNEHPRLALDRGFETNLTGLAWSRVADDRMTEVELWFPWASELLVDYLMEVTKDEKRADQYVKEHQKHRRQVVVLP